MKVNLDMQARGRVKTTLTDIRTGEKEVHEQDNLLLNDFMDSWFVTDRDRFLSDLTMSDCYLDTSDLPAEPNQMGVQGSALAINRNGETIYSEPPYSARSGNITYGAVDLSFSPDDNILAVAKNRSPGIEFYDVKNDYEELFYVSNPPPTCNGIDFSPDGNYLACAHSAINGKNLTVYDVQNEYAEVEGIEIDSGNATMCKFSHCGRYLALAFDRAPNLVVYDVWNAFSKLEGIEIERFSTCYKIDFSRDGKYVALLISSAPYLVVYDIQNGFERVDELEHQESTNGSCSFSHDGRYLAVAVSSSPFLAIYDTQDEFKKIEIPPLLLENRGTCVFLSNNVLVLNTARRISGTWYRYVGFLNIDTFEFAAEFPLKVTTWASSERIDMSNDGNLLAITHSNGQVLNTFDMLGKFKSNFRHKRRWTFAAGVGTGTINSLVLRTSTTSVWTSRVLLDFPINKTEFHELEVEWEFEVILNPVTSAVIEGGQIDNITDVNIKIEIPLVLAKEIIYNRSYFQWLGDSSPTLYLGNSNAPYKYPSENHIQGVEFATYSNPEIKQLEPYVNGSLERTVRVFLDTDQGNDYPIAEMVLDNLCRLTFNPPLEKIDTYRLYIDLTFKWNRGE